MRYRMAEPIFDDLEPVQPQPEPVIIEVISVSPAVDDDDMWRAVISTSGRPIHAVFSSFQQSLGISRVQNSEKNKHQSL